PNEPEDLDGFQDADGCPDPDNDQDGIPDVIDKCPNEPEDYDGFQDTDGCPDPDNDGDGVPDVIDKCPNEPGPPPDRCPEQLPHAGPRMTADRIDLGGERIEFVQRTAKLTPQSVTLLDGVAAVMNRHPTVRIRIEVGVERTGQDKPSRDADMRLSAERAR